jgi:site-specific recombinase XerD
MTFEGLAEKYLDLTSPKKRSHRVEKYILKTLQQYFGKFRISDMNGDDAEPYQAVRSKSVKPAPINREMTVAKHMFTKAVEWNHIPDHPFRTVRSLSVPKRDERVLSGDEEIKLLDASDRVR